MKASQYKIINPQKDLIYLYCDYHDEPESICDVPCSGLYEALFAKLNPRELRFLIMCYHRWQLMRFYHDREQERDYLKTSGPDIVSSMEELTLVSLRHQKEMDIAHRTEIFRLKRDVFLEKFKRLATAFPGWIPPSYLQC